MARKQKAKDDGPVTVEPNGESFVLKLPNGTTIGTAPTRSQARKQAAAFNYFWQEMDGPNLQVLALLGRAFLAGVATMAQPGKRFNIRIGGLGVGGKVDEDGRVELPTGWREMLASEMQAQTKDTP